MSAFVFHFLIFWRKSHFMMSSGAMMIVHTKLSLIYIYTLQPAVWDMLCFSSGTMSSSQQIKYFCFLLLLRLKIEGLAVNRGLNVHFANYFMRLIFTISSPSKKKDIICITNMLCFPTIVFSTPSSRFPSIFFVEDFFPAKLLSHQNAALLLNADAWPAQRFARLRGLAVTVCSRPIDAFEVLKIGVDLCWITAPRRAISGYWSLTPLTTNQRPSHLPSKHLSPITQSSPPPPSPLMGFLSMQRRAEGLKVATPQSLGVICVAASVNRSYFPDMHR